MRRKGSIHQRESQERESSRPPERLAGGTPQLWDRIHEDNRDLLTGALYPLATAPERAMLEVTLERGGLAPGRSVSELGCGASRYLPYLARDRGCVAHGVDFSRAGVEQTKLALASVDQSSDGIVEGRIEDYVREHRERFDTVVSYGLVEHFADLDEVVKWHLECTRRGGRVVITAPNLNRWNLSWARRVAPRLFTWHRPISAAAVARALEGGGGGEVEVEFLGGPRLFAHPDPEGRTRIQHALARATRKVVNGTGEAAYRLRAPAAARHAGERLSPFFAVIATRAP